MRRIKFVTRATDFITFFVINPYFQQLEEPDHESNQWNTRRQLERKKNKSTANFHLLAVNRTLNASQLLSSIKLKGLLTSSSSVCNLFAFLRLVIRSCGNVNIQLITINNKANTCLPLNLLIPSICFD